MSAVSEFVKIHWAELGTLAGGVSALYLWLRARWREHVKDKRDDDASQFERERSYSQTLELRIKEMKSELADEQKRYQDLFQEKVELEIKLSKAEGNFVSVEDTLISVVKADPGYAWIKRREPNSDGPADYLMVWVSPKFARDLLQGGPETYAEKTDYMIWDLVTAERFHEEDERAYNTPGGIVTLEPATGGPRQVNLLSVSRKFKIAPPGHPFEYIMGRAELFSPENLPEQYHSLRPKN